MNSVKITYLVCQTIIQLSLLMLAIFAPILITPGYYWWSVITGILMISGSVGCSSRMNSWNDFGNDFGNV